ncbi:MAG: MbtH family NRPS accessory protein [Cyanobacteria bacterium J06623_4]
MSQQTYRVVINNEGRYSIWPTYKEIPWGWHADAKSGTKEDCLDYIGDTWTDMRPLSLQKAMNEPQKAQANHD